MKAHGADLVVRALEDEGVRFTFGIPGTHNIELYDALERSEKITPVLVTDEQSASFMADAVARSGAGPGVANVVPGAGVTHCLSGVAEAFMDNVPLVVLTCGIRTDTGKAYQLHDVDQLAVLRPITKAQLRPATLAEVYPTVRRAFAIARSGAPGPVAVEISANHYFIAEDVPEPRAESPIAPAPPEDAQVEAAAKLLASAKHPALYLGFGARGATELAKQVAERLGAPVSTTIQGKGVFPERHPLWLWNGRGPSAPPFARAIDERCDALLAVGCRFGEVATASYGFQTPEALIHVDIDRSVFDRNYKTKLAIEADAADFLRALLAKLPPARDRAALEAEIAKGHQEVFAAWRADRSESRVTPIALFDALHEKCAPRTIYVTDSGNGTFLAMEHLRLQEPGCFLGPIDYSCMGYSVPGAIGAKIANPDRDVVALAGDGALLMTGLEMLTAASYGVGVVVCVLRDEELGQIAAFQRASLDRDTCSVLAPYSVEALAKATNCEYVRAAKDGEVAGALEQALAKARARRPVWLEVAIDYSRKTYFTKGAIATNFWRLPLSERLKKVGRVVGRKAASFVGLGGPAKKHHELPAS